MGEEPSNSSNPGPRKMRFAPKIPTRRAPPLSAAKVERPDAVDVADAALSSELLRLVQQSKQGSARPKFEKKAAPVQIAFGYGDASTSARSFRISKGGSSSSNSNSNNGLKHQGGPSSDGGTNAAAGQRTGQRTDEEYIEPWDYYSYYPVTLPLRRPYSGKPELLDKQEFESALQIHDHQDPMNSAAELSLLDEWDKPQFFLFQLPACLPFAKRSAVAKKSASDSSSRGRDRSDEACSLEELPAGFMGKMLVYESGAIKMKLGDTLFDVNPGSECVFAQDVAAIDTEHKQCCVLGELSKRIVVTPDLGTALDS